MTTHKPATSLSVDEVIERHKRQDPDFSERWDRGAFARDVAHAVLRYRIDHGLDMDQLAARLGVDSEMVGVLEEGEDDPDIGTLRLLSERLGLRFALDIHPGPSSGVEVIHSVA